MMKLKKSKTKQDAFITVVINKNNVRHIGVAYVRIMYVLFRYECSATNTVGFAKRTVLIEVKEDSLSYSGQHPAPLPIPPSHRRGVPSRQHSISAMYGSAVFLHCPESIGSARGTFWQLPSKIIMEHRYR